MNLKEAKFRGEENQLRPKTNHLELPCCAKLPQSNNLKNKFFESLIWAKHKEPQTQLLKSFFLEEAPVIHYKLNTSYCFCFFI